MSSASSTRDQIGMHGCFSELGIGIVEYREVSALFFVIWGGLGNILCYDLLLCILYTLPPPDIRAHCRHSLEWSGLWTRISPQASTAAHYSAKRAKDENGKLQNKTGCTVTFSDCVWELRLNLTFHLFPEWLWLTQMLSDVSSCDEVASWVSLWPVFMDRPSLCFSTAYVLNVSAEPSCGGFALSFCLQTCCFI